MVVLSWKKVNEENIWSVLFMLFIDLVVAVVTVYMCRDDTARMQNGVV